VHSYLERLQEVEPEVALAEIDDEDDRAACAAVELEGLPIGGMAAEVAFAFDPSAGVARELGRGLDRDYSAASSDEICGTVDVLGVTDDAVYVGDYKSGWGDVPPARSNRQIHFAAVAATIAYGKASAVGEIIRTRPGAPPWISRAEFSALDLMTMRGELRGIDALVEGERVSRAVGYDPTVTEGPHCKYCPSVHSCPAKKSLALELGGSALATAGDLVGELTPATAAEAWRRVQIIEELCKIVRGQIRDYAWQRPIPLGRGRYLGRVESRGRDTIDGDALHARASELYGDEIAELAAPAVRAGAKKHIDAALREARTKGLIRSAAPAKRELLKDLARSGGLTPGAARTKIDEYRATCCATDGCDAQAMTAGGTCDLCALDAEMIGAE
jgi:hypothetical protein